MTSSRRLPALISGAVALSLVLGGCSLVEEGSELVASAGKDVLAHAAIAALVSDLERLDGVEAATYELETDTPLGDLGRIGVTAASTIESSQLERLSDTLREGFGAIEQVAVEPHASVTVSGETTGKFDLWAIPETNEAFVENVEFWRAASAAVETEVWVELFGDGAGEVGMRSITIPYESDRDEATDLVIENYAALRDVAVVDDDIPNYWQVAGIQSSEQLAPSMFVELVSDLRKIMPIFFYPVESDAIAGDSDFPEGFQVSWMPSGTNEGLGEVFVSSNEYTDDSRSDAIRAAVRTSEIEGVNFQFVTGDRGFWMHTSVCNGSVGVTADDDLFFEDVASSGAKLLDGAGPGACFPN
tara:strand:+ start:96 stop:1169 length:1074 start_codon:yes stop_codon:yes gene_type:complete